MSLESKTKYLSLYAEPEARELPAHFFEGTTFDFGLTLPLRGEDPIEIESRLFCLENIATQSRKRLIVTAIINGIGTNHPQYHDSHISLVNHLNEQSKPWQDHFLLQNRSSYFTVLWVDRALQRPFLPKQGVGLARKIGCDILIRLDVESKLLGNYLFTTDADAAIPANYFEMPEPQSESAFHFPYRHAIQDFEGREALMLYEIHLRYYFLGLHWARSPYAYPTIGSCLAIHKNAYVQVRGFQDRQAGEDFHLLNKLRKLGPIKYRSSQPIVLRGRFSERVPFGTGRSTIEIYDQLKRNEPFKLYAPEAFYFLKSFLEIVTNLLSESKDTGLEAFGEYLRNLNLSDSRCFQALEKLGIPTIIQEAFSTRTTAQSRLRHFHTAFDGLKTLRLIHLLQEPCFSPLFWKEALARAPFCEVFKPDSLPEEALLHLQAIEERALDTSFVTSNSF